MRRVADRYYIIAIVAAVALLLSSILVIPHLTTGISIQSDSHRRIIAFETKVVPKEAQTFSNQYGAQNGNDRYDRIIEFRYVKVGDLQPNSSVWIFNPFDSVVNNSLYKKPLGSFTDQEKGEILSKIDRYAYYQLVRLPDWLGGSENTTSAYRAYNAISVTQKCVTKYWPQEGRIRLEDPCSGDLYRPWDGFAFGGPAGVGFSSGLIISQGSYQGLATLNLTSDSEGYIIAKRPDTSPTANGVPGEGRAFSSDALQISSQGMIDAASQSIGYRLPFLPSIPIYRQLNNIMISYDLRGNHNPAIYDQTDTPPVVMRAIYSGPEYPEGTFISSTLADRYPTLKLDAITNGSYMNNTDMAVPDLDNKDLRTALGLDEANYDSEGCYYNSTATAGAKIHYSVKYGSGIAGEYAIFHAPAIDRTGPAWQSPAADERYTCFSTALIWGQNLDDDSSANLLVLVRVQDYDLGKLESLVNELPIK